MWIDTYQCCLISMVKLMSQWSVPSLTNWFWERSDCGSEISNEIIPIQSNFVLVLMLGKCDPMSSSHFWFLVQSLPICQLKSKFVSNLFLVILLLCPKTVAGSFGRQSNGIPNDAVGSLLNHERAEVGLKSASNIYRSRNSVILSLIIISIECPH